MRLVHVRAELVIFSPLFLPLLSSCPFTDRFSEMKTDDLNFENLRKTVFQNANQKASITLCTCPHNFRCTCKKRPRFVASCCDGQGAPTKRHAA